VPGLPESISPPVVVARHWELVGSLRGVPFIGLPEMQSGSPCRGWTGRFFHSQNMTFAYWEVADGAADLHEHDHLQEEVWNVVDGEILLVIDGCERRMGPGDAAVVPPSTRHAAKPIGTCRAIIVDYPIRLELPGSSS
jgi:mannose-6-phosphate isomerase-like protein (cupin superfamily)